MNKHLGPQAPLSDAELAALGQRDGDCIMPVPADASPPALKLNGRDPDHRYDYRGADGNLLGHVLRWDARPDAPKEIQPATYWRNGSGKGAWHLKTWPGKRPLYGLDRLPRAPTLCTGSVRKSPIIAIETRH